MGIKHSTVSHRLSALYSGNIFQSQGYFSGAARTFEQLSHSVGSQSLAFEQSYVKVVGMWTPHITPGSWDVRSLPEWKVLWQTLQAWKHQSDMVVENRVYFSGLKKKIKQV